MCMTFVEPNIQANSFIFHVDWSSANKFTINLNKAKALIIALKLIMPLSNIPFSIDNLPVQVVNSKYLGLVLFYKLCCANCIANMEKKIAESVEIISKLFYVF